MCDRCARRGDPERTDLCRRIRQATEGLAPEEFTTGELRAFAELLGSIAGAHLGRSHQYQREAAMTDRRHYLWKLEQITDIVGLDDLTAAELASLADLLGPAHTRVLTGQRAPALRLVREDTAELGPRR